MTSPVATSLLQHRRCRACHRPALLGERRSRSPAPTSSPTPRWSRSAVRATRYRGITHIRHVRRPGACSTTVSVTCTTPGGTSSTQSLTITGGGSATTLRKGASIIWRGDVLPTPTSAPLKVSWCALRLGQLLLRRRRQRARAPKAIRGPQTVTPNYVRRQCAYRRDELGGHRSAVPRRQSRR